MSLLRPRQSTEAELAAFEQTCRRLGGFDDQIVFEWVDGFLSALAAGPRVPATGEWLAALFDDTFDRAFADPEDHAQALRGRRCHRTTLPAIPRWRARAARRPAR